MVLRKACSFQYMLFSQLELLVRESRREGRKRTDLLVKDGVAVANHAEVALEVLDVDCVEAD